MPHKETFRTENGPEIVLLWRRWSCASGMAGKGSKMVLFLGIEKDTTEEEEVEVEEVEVEVEEEVEEETVKEVDEKKNKEIKRKLKKTFS
ncbi:hypothetical protein E2C01_050520 [Portunus trituberculatus]|uniref:Uncharacterized protein n=1 Tax=Portunus trituberculatus TaxID=210409 RepID=A0A5B7GHR9_PORTR|nr:hypothetical protein [Portunus trituberculatus]